MKTKKQIFVIASAIIITLTIALSTVFGQNKVDKQSIAPLTEEEDNALVGVWESKAPVAANCQTGLPDADSPIIRALYTFNQGGTMSEENTDPIDGPYRTTAHGIWKRTSPLNYTAVYLHYSFDPDRTHTVTVKIRTNIRFDSFGRSPNSFTENGTFEVLDPNDSDKVVFSGCFTDTARRLKF